MNSEEFIRYLDGHKGEAWVVNPETLGVAKQLESEGMLQQTGYRKNGREFCFELTPKGRAFVDYSLKRLPGGGGQGKRAAKAIGNAAYNYIQAFKAENPVGLFSELKGISKSLNPSPDSNPILLPNIEPMRLEQPQRKQLKKTDDQDSVIIGGKKYVKAEDEYVTVNGKRYKKAD